mgnify:CR=1 FL=1
MNRRHANENIRNDLTKSAKNTVILIPATQAAVINADQINDGSMVLSNIEDGDVILPPLSGATRPPRVDRGVLAAVGSSFRLLSFGGVPPRPPLA